mmetsp:Transcript_15617/g.35889  ORF Transcript_15617/g.35889 Transcript_15617/m.35889 type:complete len:629 (+) Transcript_15617:53-1939(+)
MAHMNSSGLPDLDLSRLSFLEHVLPTHVHLLHLHRSHWTREQLHQRLITFGAWMACWFMILGLAALMALLKRDHGSIIAGLAYYKERLKARSGSTRGDSRDVFEYALLPGVNADEDDESWGSFNRTGAGLTAEELEKLAKRKADTGGEDPNAPDADDKSKAAASRLGLTPEELAARREEKAKAQGLAQPLLSVEEKKALIEMQLAESTKKTDNVSLLQRVKIPISLVLYSIYIFLCIGLPVLTSDAVSCKNGYPWELHMPFFHFFILVKLWELYLLAFDSTLLGVLSLPQFVFTFGSSFLGFADGYSDACSTIVAYKCNSNLWSYMALVYLIGVILLQWIAMGIISLCFDSSRACFFKMMHMDALATCCTLRPTDTKALLAWKMVNWFRCLGEDLPQSALQTLFVLHVKRNYLMIISITIGACTSMLAVYNAAKRAAEAAGTNWERLQSLHGMRQAIDEKNEKQYSAQVDRAWESGADPAQILDLEVEAEREFLYLAGQPLVPSAGQSLDDVRREALYAKVIEQATESDFYPKRRRTVAFAVEASRGRESFLRELETPESPAYKHGLLHEGRHTKRLYESRRRTVEWAVKAQIERDARIRNMLVEADGYCIGSKPKTPGEEADVPYYG